MVNVTGITVIFLTSIHECKTKE